MLEVEKIKVLFTVTNETQMSNHLFQDQNALSDDGLSWPTWVVVPLEEALEQKSYPIRIGGQGKG